MPDKPLTAIIFLLALCAFANAEEKRHPGIEKIEARSLDLTWEGPSQRPSQELLEFLANWETIDGEWISPLEVKELDIPESQNETIPER